MAVGLGLGLFLGGLAGFVMAAALGDKTQSVAPAPRYVLGGVDLTGIDVSQPFWIDFSVPSNSSTATKREALRRLQSAMLEFQQVNSDWLCEVFGSVNSDEFGLRVTPLGAIRRVVRNT